MKGENHITHLIDTEKVSEKIQQFMIKILSELETERNSLDLIERIQLILWKIMLSFRCEKQDKRVLVSLLLKIVLEIQLKGKEKEIKAAGLERKKQNSTYRGSFKVNFIW